MKNLFIFRENIHDIKNFQIIANENKKYSEIRVGNYRGGFKGGRGERAT